MRYLVAHLLSGKPKTYHESLTAEIAEEFGRRDLRERIPPHFTLKAPFEANEVEIAELKDLLEEVAANKEAGTVRIDGFGHFGTNVIYLDANAEAKTRVFLDQFPVALEGLSWIAFDRYDYDLTLHATLVRPKHKGEFTKVWNFLKDRDPAFETTFDNIALLAFDSGCWRTAERYSL